jgi:hypothetical protein
LQAGAARSTERARQQRGLLRSSTGAGALSKHVVMAAGARALLDKTLTHHTSRALVPPLLIT